jgi:hypothetical protein
MKNVIICLLLAAIAVSAQNKQRIAVLPSVGDLDPQRLILLTDKVREIATQNLPMEDFNVLKQDVITKMIGEEELYRSCKEGVCIGDLAKKTNANYGARCDVVRLDDGLVLKFELYSVNEEAIFETFTDYNVKDFPGMLALLEARLPNTFKKMMNAQKKTNDMARAEETKPAAKPEPKPKPEFKISAGGGAFLANGSGGGIDWASSEEKVAMPYTGGGAYIFLDAVYAEAFAGFWAGGGKWTSGDATYQNDLPDMPRASVNIGAFAKYPIAAGIVKMFPLIGVEYEASVSGKLVHADGREEAFDGGALSALWFRFGGGADFDLSQSLYLRAEFLYGLRTANAYEKDLAEEETGFGGGTRAGYGLTLKAGAGVRF